VILFAGIQVFAGYQVCCAWREAYQASTWKCYPAYFFLLVLLLCLWNWRHAWPLGRSVWNFQTVSTSRVLLHFDPKLKGRRDFAVLLKQIEAELDALAVWFGFSLRQRPIIYLYSSCQDVARVMGRQVAGVALPQPNAILIGNDTNLMEILRHELTHLFSFRWSVEAPPLLTEGLAVCLQRTRDGIALDSAARACFGNHSLSLSQLLRQRGFHRPSHQDASYRLAGSFTAFLIRRYGWKKFRKCYRTANPYFFRNNFRKALGLTFEEAERKWRNALVTEESPSMKVLRKRLERDLAF